MIPQTCNILHYGANKLAICGCLWYIKLMNQEQVKIVEAFGAVQADARFYRGASKAFDSLVPASTNPDMNARGAEEAERIRLRTEVLLRAVEEFHRGISIDPNSVVKGILNPSKSTSEE